MLEANLKVQAHAACVTFAGRRRGVPSAVSSGDEDEKMSEASFSSDSAFSMESAGRSASPEAGSVRR
jgi:hypothetical protein